MKDENLKKFRCKHCGSEMYKIDIENHRYQCEQKRLDANVNHTTGKIMDMLKNFGKGKQ